MKHLNIQSPIGNLLEQLQNLDPNLEKSLDLLLTKIFGILVTFLSNEITNQQKQIWFALAKYYPDPKSGSELATLIGSSKISKSIYKSINELKKRKMISVHQPHPRTFSIQANPEHPITEIMIDICKYYGKRL